MRFVLVWLISICKILVEKEKPTQALFPYLKVFKVAEHSFRERFR